MPQPPDPLRKNHPTTQILRRCWRKMNTRDEHWMHVILGEEGSGKSHTALKLGSMLDPDFDVSNVYFSPARLLEDLRDGRYSVGDVYVLDEAGVSLGNRTWQESGQKKLNQALQLIRNHNIGLIFTLPRLGELDSQAQGRLHSYFEIGEKEPNEYVAGRWRWLDPDRVDMSGKIYRKKPRYNGQPVPRVKFTPPTDAGLIDEYEERKAEFQRDFYDRAVDELDDNDGEDSSQSPQEIAEEIRQNGGADEYLREINNGTQVIMDTDRIAIDHDLTDRKAKKVKKLLLDDVDREDVL